MGLTNVFNIAGSAMTAETQRLSTTASNMSNANVVSGSPDEVYRAQYPVFKAIAEDVRQEWGLEKSSAGVKLDGVYESSAEPVKRHEPNNPLADKDGFVYASNINYVEELANMISASRSYEMELEVLGTVKQLIQRTLQVGE